MVKNSRTKELMDGLMTAFVDQSNNSNLAYRSEFIYNDHKQGKKGGCRIKRQSFLQKRIRAGLRKARLLV